MKNKESARQVAWNYIVDNEPKIKREEPLKAVVDFYNFLERKNLFYPRLWERTTIIEQQKEKDTLQNTEEK